MSSIIDHWGDNARALAATGGILGDPGSPGGGHWHDMDMLVIGNYQQNKGSNCLSDAEEHTQMALWSISASPLIMGNGACFEELRSSTLLSFSC